MIPITVNSSSCSNELINGMLESLNQIRSQHKAPELQLDITISMVSQAWAQHLFETGGYDHDPSVNSSNYGKDVLLMGDFKVDTLDPSFAPMINFPGYLLSTLEEFGINSYPYYGTEPPESEKTKYEPFTAVIWKSSEKVGIGCSSKYVSKTFTTVNFVVNLSPMGNVKDQYASNVLNS